MLPLRSQSTTQGVVGGTVAGPGGVALADAEVDLTNADTGHIYQSRSDAQGNFHFLGLSPGNYEAWITQTGFARLHIAHVPVEVGRFTPCPRTSPSLMRRRPSKFGSPAPCST